MYSLHTHNVLQFLDDYGQTENAAEKFPYCFFGLFHNRSKCLINYI